VGDHHFYTTQSTAWSSHFKPQTIPAGTLHLLDHLYSSDLAKEMAFEARTLKTHRGLAGSTEGWGEVAGPHQPPCLHSSLQPLRHRSRWPWV